MKKNNSAKMRRWMAVAGVLVLIGGGGAVYYKKTKAAAAAGAVYNAATVTKGDLTAVISSSGTVQPTQQYNVVSLATGDVLSDNLSEGDEVQEGQVLYEIDRSEAERNIQKYEIALKKQQISNDQTQNSYSGTSATVTVSSGASVFGYVNATSMKIGKSVLAQGVTILDVASGGETANIFLSRLDGVTLSSDDVLLAAMNASGQVESLILDDFTGDIALYGVATSVSEQDTDSGSKSSYVIDIGGTSKTYSYADCKQNITAGPVRIYANSDGETVIKNLTKVAVDTVNGSYVTDQNGTQHRISGSTLVYDVSEGTPITSTLNQLLAGSYSTVTAYIDKSLSDGGAVRVIYFK